MGRVNQDNPTTNSDHIRVDNSLVGNQANRFLLGHVSTTNPERTAEAFADASAILHHPPADAFRYMRAYGCLGPKQKPTN